MLKMHLFFVDLIKVYSSANHNIKWHSHYYSCMECEERDCTGSIQWLGQEKV